MLSLRSRHWSDYFGIDGDQVRAYAQEQSDSQYYVLKKKKCPTMKSVIISR